jgi:DNA-binding MurR/RpiR family transcriptional regulator
MLIGITASGKTPYVISALKHANKMGATTASISSNASKEIKDVADINIVVDTGAEVLSGSTRLKAGTAAKMICNMISTSILASSGKIFGNLMVDMQLINQKFLERGKSIVMSVTNCSEKEALRYLELADMRPKIAILMILTGLSKEEADNQLKEKKGFIRNVLLETEEAETNFLQEIQLALPELSKSEKKVANYLLENPESTLQMTIHELSEKAETSSASVVRFCKSMGIESFSQLKIQLSANTKKETISTTTEISKNDSSLNIIDKTLNSTVQLLRNTAEQIPVKTLLKVSDLMKEADNIFVYGIGSSFLIAQEFMQRWNRLGKKVYAITDRDLIISMLSTSKEKNLFLAISYSGATKEVVSLAQFIKSLNIPTVGLSKKGTHPLSKNVDYLLTTSRVPSSELRSGTLLSKFAQLLVIDTLYSFYTSSDYEDTLKMLKTSKSALKKFHSAD